MINEALGIPPVASEHGHMIDQMMEFLNWFIILLLVGWTLFFFFCLFRFNRKTNPKASYIGVRSHASSHLEIGVVLVEAILLLGFAFPLWGTRVNDYPTTPETVRVRAVGYQFGWLIHYPGPDGKFGNTDLSKVSAADSDTQIGLSREGFGADDIIRTTLTLPKDRPAIVQLSSKDVIHNYSIKAMRIAQDAIPGMEIPMWFTPIKEGSYDVVCAQLCGSGHAAMASTMTVVPNEEFTAEFEGGSDVAASNKETVDAVAAVN